MSIKAETSFSLKDDLFNPQTVAELGAALNSAYPAFARQDFEREVLAAFPDLELKERINWMVETAHRHLPPELDAAREIWQAALPAPLDPTLNDDDFGRFIWVVPGEYVARYGCNAEQLAASLDFLREATKRFSSESAIRPFLLSFPDETMARVREWSRDDNYHVRRLASEGIRPFLPWAARVVLPAADVLAVLDNLHADPTRYVTRSVANNLNDLTRIEPGAVLKTLQGWAEQGRQDEQELEWMTRHALRTLLSADDPAALELVGYPLDPKFRLRDIEVSTEVKVGDALTWQSTLTSAKSQKLKVALKVGFLKANGRHAAKVFKVKDAELGPGEELAISKRIRFKPMTTRVLYPGTHYVELVVNGVSRGKRSFELRA